MREAERYAGNSHLFYGLYIATAIIAVICGTIYLPDLVPDDWQTLTRIGCFLALAIAAAGGWQALRKRRFDGYLRALLPGYEGVRFPIYHLLSHRGPGFERGFPDDAIYSLAEADGGYMVLSNMKTETPHDMIGGTPVRGAAGRAYLSLNRRRIVAVDVIERSDAEIKASAVDTRSDSDRYASFFVQKVTGRKTKTTIVPFAAYVAVTLAEDDGYSELVWAIPTTVTGDVLKLLGDEDARSEEGDWLVDAAVGKVKGEAHDYVTDKANDLAGMAVGAPPVELFHEGMGVVHEVQSWANPDAAKIASTDGARGRKLARMIGARIRRHAGLDQPTVEAVSVSAA